MPQTIGHFRHFITAIAALLCAANGLARADALPGMAGRLTGSLRYIDTSTSAVNTLTEQGITYDRSGNLFTLNRYDASSGTTPSESLSFSYSGPKRTGWSYDSHGNVTSDPKAGTTVAWNVLDMPGTLTSGSTGTQRDYLADGTLVQVSDGSTTRLYLEDMVFNQTGSTLSLESAGWDGGRLLPGSGTDKVLYYVTDHLGSVRVVKDGSGNIRQRYDYYPYGSVARSWTSSSTTDNSEKRFRFGGKEITGTALGALSIGADKYLDFGARLYSPGTAMWLSQDPMAEKYYPLTPYMYCAGSPGNVVDPEGLSWYYMGVDGVVILVKETDDSFDLLYSQDSGGEEPLVVYNTSILKDLSSPREEGFHYATTSSLELLKVFDYVTTHSNIEWAIGSYRDDANGSKIALVAGINGNSVDPIYRIKSITEESVITNIHTHIAPIQDHGASGFHFPTFIPNDQYNAQNLENKMKEKGLSSPMLYVYEVPYGIIYKYNSRNGSINASHYSISKIKQLLRL